MTIALDFESRSRADLKKIGGRNYWAHASTEAICCCWSRLETGESGTWRPGDPSPPWVGTGETLMAHNMTGFDRFGCYKYGWLSPDDHWLDSAELCVVQGLPRSLEALGERYGIPKDLEASKFTTALSTCRRPSGKKNPDAVPADLWSLMTDAEKREFGAQKALTPNVVARVVAYCQNDVEIMRVAAPDSLEWVALEPDVERVSRIVNDRGVAFDRDLARALIECDADNAQREIDAIAEECGVTADELRTVVNSPAQFCEHTGAPNAQAETIELMIAAGREGPYGELGYLLAKARQSLASIASGKLNAGLRFCSPDGRLRDSLLYFGGHTGRYSGRGMQLHNLPRPHKRYEDWTCQQIDDLANAVKSGRHRATQDEVELLVRATLWAPGDDAFVVQDFSGVEARALAWVAGDERALEVFRAGDVDAYKVMASKVFNVPYEAVEKWQRQIGKNAELGAGYGMGADKFDEYCLKAGTNLKALGIAPKVVINAWRALHAPVKLFWDAVQKSMLAAVGGHASEVACFSFRPSSNGRDVAVFLPSGRPVVYSNVRVHVKETKYGPRPSICYDEVKDGRVVEGWLYGGKITENLVQALCRELLVGAMVRAEDGCLPIVLHVHDELVAEVPCAIAADAAEYLHEIMTTLPDWAAGFPVGAAGFNGKRYRK